MKPSMIRGTHPALGCTRIVIKVGRLSILTPHFVVLERKSKWNLASCFGHPLLVNPRQRGELRVLERCYKEYITSSVACGGDTRDVNVRPKAVITVED